MKSLFDFEEDLNGVKSLGAAQAMPTIVEPESTGGKGLFDSAVLLSLELRVFGTSRKLTNAEYEVDASKEKTRATKGILKSAELKAISKYDAESRRLVSLYTLPSQFRAGLYVLPLASIEVVDAMLQERQGGRAALIQAFCAKYPDLRWADSLPADQGGLGSCYHEADYPDVSAVREAFAMSYSYTEFTAPGKLKGISMAIYEREKEKAQSTWRNAIEEGQALLRGAFASLITHMSDRLAPGADGKPKIFRDSLISNVTDFLSTFDARNLAGDEELAKLVKQASDMLKGVSTDDLRKSDTVKAAVMARVDSIKTALDSMVADRPGRKIDFNDAWGDL